MPRLQYTCDVGIPMYQPPEFQNISSFRDVDRTAIHDNFALAVFVFLLLFMGRHPFSGRYLGPGDMPIEKAIKGFSFAYSNSAATMMM
jgi:DNA-binding helix-hairpin-helix protein with protein kinase domain